MPPRTFWQRPGRSGAGHERARSATCLACLDQVVQWLDAMQVDGEPPADADRSADAIVRRFELRAGHPAPPTGSDERQGPPSGWRGRTAGATRGCRVRAAAAVRYMPDPDAFSAARIRWPWWQPCRASWSLESRRRPWPALDALDPFACELTILALISGTVRRGRTACSQPVRDQVDIQPVAVAAGADAAARTDVAGGPGAARGADRAPRREGAR